MKDFESLHDEGRLLELPCPIGTTIYEIVDVCELVDDCHTKLKCRGCEYRNIYVEPTQFHVCMLDDNGQLPEEYFVSEAEAKVVASALMIEQIQEVTSK